MYQHSNHLSKELVSGLYNSSSCHISLISKILSCLGSHGGEFDILVECKTQGLGLGVKRVVQGNLIFSSSYITFEKKVVCFVLVSLSQSLQFLPTVVLDSVQYEGDCFKKEKDQ